MSCVMLLNVSSFILQI